MTFLHVSVLAGCLAALAPILFHMLGRRQPKTLEFPAIRFVKKTAVEAQRGWSVKRWILLALRVLMVLLLAAALAAPRVASGLFANSLLGGLLAILATLGSLAAMVLWGRKRGWV
ncbi:MAG: BatA domain-containing protein, partial [Planctomycetaceae bacterium]|nr:BatA domain-containing protein [Planctomycetaceae bacterium]